MLRVKTKREVKKNKLAVIGLDGVSYQLLTLLSSQGVLPVLGKLIREGRLVQTVSPLPEVSPVSWTSMMSGLAPGQHNVFGFTELDPDNYEYRFPYFPSLPVRLIWEELAFPGPFRSLVVNLPHTYPARSLNGILVSGFVAVDLARAVFPRNILPVLKKHGYRVDPDFSLVAKNKQLFLADLQDTLAARYNFLHEMMTEAWDLLVFVITETDRINHFFYQSLADEGSPYRGEFMEFYRQVDEVVGKLIKELNRGGTPFIIVSDHGFVELKTEVYLSHYLKEWGYLQVDGDKPRDLQGIKETSLAFCLDPSRIYIHRAGKYRRGQVAAGDVERIREELRDRFKDLCIEGEPVCQRVYYKEELYSGPYLDQAPDLVLHARDGFDLKSGLTRDKAHDKAEFEGMHSSHNAIFIDGGAGLSIQPANRVDVIGQEIKSFFTSARD